MIQTYITPAIPDLDPAHPDYDNLVKYAGRVPKYFLDYPFLGTTLWCVSVSPLEIDPLPDGTRQWTLDYYIMICDAPDFSYIDAQPDTLLFNRTSIINNPADFEALGVSLSGININSAAKVIERRFVQWIRDGVDQDFSQIIGQLSVRGVSIGDVSSSWDL